MTVYVVFVAKFDIITVQYLVKGTGTASGTVYSVSTVQLSTPVHQKYLCLRVDIHTYTSAVQVHSTGYNC